MPRYRYHPACGEREGRPRSMAAGNTALVPTKVRQYNRGCSIPRDYRNHRETMPGTSKKTVNGRPKYQLLPDLPQEEFEALKADIAARGVQYAVIQDEQGNTLDGHQRERALAELGIKRYPITVMSGLAEEEKRHLVYSLNVKRRHLSTKQKQALVEQELKRTPDIASQWLAEILGVDTKTVQAARKRLESTLEIPVLKKSAWQGWQESSRQLHQSHRQLGQRVEDRPCHRPKTPTILQRQDPGHRYSQPSRS